MHGLEDILEVYDEDCIIEESPEFELESNSQEGEVTPSHEEGISVHDLSGEKPQDTIKV